MGRNQWPRPPSLAPSGQFTLRIAGDAADGHFVPIDRHPTPSVASRHLPLTGGVGPRSPITGLPLEVGQNISGAQNQECLSAVPSGPTGGLSGRKIGAGAVPLLRLPPPNQRARSVFRRRGGLWPPASLLPVGKRRPKARRMRAGHETTKFSTGRERIRRSAHKTRFNSSAAS